MKKVFVKIFIILLITLFVFQYNLIVYADEITDLQNQQSNNQKQIDEMEEKKEEVSQEKSNTETQIDELNKQISSYENEIGELEYKIDDLNTQIAETEEKINQKQEDYDKQKELLETRLIATYEAGETSFLDVLLCSNSLSELISNYYYISEITQNDAQLMEDIENEKKEIEQAKVNLENNKKELDNSKIQKEAKAVELQAAKSEKTKYVSQLSQEEQELQQQIDELTRDNQQILNDIRIAQEKYKKQLEELANKKPSGNNGGGSSTSGTSNKGGFIRPVNSGTVTANGYYSTGKFHGAIDYGVNVGTPVYAAADGVVLTTKSLTTSYGTYVVIQHANGLQTWYAHGTPGSICVSPGQTVSQGQMIMKSGNSGNSQGPHLHFEVRRAPYTYSYSATKYGDDCRVDPNLYF